MLLNFDMQSWWFVLFTDEYTTEYDSILRVYSYINTYLHCILFYENQIITKIF